MISTGNVRGNPRAFAFGPKHWQTLLLQYHVHPTEHDDGMECLAVNHQQSTGTSTGTSSQDTEW